MKFRKKAVVIEATQWNPEAPPTSAPDWLMQALLHGTVFIMKDRTARINTLEGLMVCSIGDWIIQGVKGEIYPCKPDIFEATYEAAE